jgi:hypothetical protein
MAGVVSVTVDLERGEVVLGARSICLEPAGQPSRFRLTGGVIVRAVTFEERSRTVRDALAEPDPTDALVSAFRAMAIEGAADVVADAVVLALAGGAEQAPGFDECGVEAARLCGWDWATVNETRAIEVDRVLAAESSHANANGWMRFVFAEEDSGDLAQIRAYLTENLLHRGIARSRGPEHEEQPQQPPAEHHSRSEAGVPEFVPVPAKPAATTVRQRYRFIDAPRPAAPAWPVSRPSILVEPLPESVRPAKTPMTVPAANTSTARIRVTKLDPDPPAETQGIAARVIEPPMLSPGAKVSRDETVLTQRVAGPAAAPAVEPAHAGSPWPPGATEASFMTRSLSAPAARTPEPVAPTPVPPVHPDWLGEISRALAAECDLRGIDA